MRNFTARRHLKEMKKGEQAFFYHTGDEKQIVGIGEIIKEPTRPDRREGSVRRVDIESGRAVAASR